MKTKKIRIFFLTAAVAVLAAAGILAARQTVPDSMRAVRGEALSLGRTPYITFNIKEDEAVEAGSFISGTRAEAMLFGFIPIKTVSINYTEREKVEVCAAPIGIKLYTSGVVVSELTDVITSGGSVNPGCECGLCEGDIIHTVNGVKIASVSQLIESVAGCGGMALKLEVTDRTGADKVLTLHPAYSETDGCYRAGIWIRNSTAGIGVMTFIDRRTGIYGGLGHAVCDETSGAVMQVGDGEVTSVLLTETVRGASGAPGELIGFLGAERYGSITANTDCGIFGRIETDNMDFDEYEVAFKQELREGRAQILATVPGGSGAQLYDVMIEKINYDSGNPTRNMIIRVTDKRLLDLTGGIVQGMSGSPVIQNGRFAAAVTHVFVNDPSVGYAIFAENMLDAAQSLEKSTGLAA